MTNPDVAARLKALQASGRASASEKPSQPPAKRSGSTGTKWTLAGGAVGAGLMMMGAMSVGATGPEASTSGPAAPQPIVIVIPQASTQASNQTLTTEAINAVAEGVPELPMQVQQPAPAHAEPQAESGGS